ncbi:hypothetical protein PQ459_06725 [Chryseobacterium sp. KACC 21268]|nr:hypothetical protein PQ459_06725 [Chryseobacterium sp. KACC 21268]
MNSTTKIIIGIIFGSFGIFIFSISYKSTLSYYLGDQVNVKIHKIDSTSYKKNTNINYNYSASVSFDYKGKIISDKKLYISEDEKAKNSIYRNYHPTFGYSKESDAPFSWVINMIGIAFIFSAILLFINKFK